MSQLTVTDHRSNPNEQIETAVKSIGGSSRRRKVFEAVYQGKTKIKTVQNLMSSTGLSRKDVLTAGKQLDGDKIIHQTKVKKETAYEKDTFYARHKSKILRLVEDPTKLEKLPTKQRPQSTIQIEVIRGIPKGIIQVQELFLDDIDSFKSAPKTFIRTIDLKTISEKKFKEGIQKIIQEKGIFKDWGGEINDLLTTRVVFRNKRIRTAFAFKGPGKRGKLTPKQMGENGDQIQRLFHSTADLFILQYWGQIAESVVEQMDAFAKIKSISEQRKIYFCIIDGDETQRIVEAFPHFFT